LPPDAYEIANAATDTRTLLCMVAEVRVKAIEINIIPKPVGLFEPESPELERGVSAWVDNNF
jgi:hypothetical protein